MTDDERRIAQIEARVREGRFLKEDFETLLASRLAWKFTAKCFSADDKELYGVIAEAAEHVRHAPDCPSIGGSGDADCTCGAAPYLTRLFEAAGLNEQTEGKR